MVLKNSGLMKVGYVFEIARKDPRFLNDLARDPYRTLEESGIDLSRGEVVAVLDIINDTSISTLAPMLSKHRKQWQAVLKEEAQRFGKEGGAKKGGGGKARGKKRSTKKGSSQGES